MIPHNALSHVATAARAGLLVSAGSHGIKFILPPGYNEELLCTLQACRQMLVDYELPVVSGNRPMLREGDLPVSDAQMRQLVAFKKGARADPYAIYAKSVIKAPLVAEAARKAASDLEARHGALQYDIEERGDRFLHVLRTAPGVDVRTFDLSELPADRRTRALHDAISWLTSEVHTMGKKPHCRATVVALASDVQLFVVSMDHIFSDLFSVRLVLNDFISLYRRHLGFSVSLPVSNVSYPDYICRSLDFARRHLKFWSLYLAGASQPEFKRGVGEQGSHETEAIRFCIGADSYSRMKCLAKEAKCTMFAVALAKVFVLLSSLTDASDITIGFISGNRDSSNRSMVALIADTVFVRAHGRTTLDVAYVSYVFASFQAALQHAQTPRTYVTEVAGIAVPTVVMNFISATSISPNARHSARSAEIASELLSTDKIIREIFQEDRQRMPQLLYMEFIDSGRDISVRFYANPLYFDEAARDEMRRVFCAA